jgi:hypothetical protein
VARDTNSPRPSEGAPTSVATLDQTKLDAFVAGFVRDLGATLHVPLVLIGERLGLCARPTSCALDEGTGRRVRLREVVTAGGFTRFRRATETPFNLALEARP